jgi:hydrogenase maturation protease
MGCKKLSLHQTGFQDVLGVADLTGRLPGELVLIGVQPETLEDYGGSLRPVVKAQIQPALDIALACLRRWGVEAEARDFELDAADFLFPASLDMAAYEAGRGGTVQTTETTGFYAESKVDQMDHETP